MLIQLTQEGAEAGIVMITSVKEVLEIAQSKGINNIEDIQVNKLLQDIKFMDQDNIPYSSSENKRIRKRLIHSYIGADYLTKIYKTSSIDVILTAMEKTIKKLEGIK